MSSYNITEYMTITDAAFSYGAKFIPDVNSSHTHYLDKQITTRLCYLIAIPIQTITRLADGILAVVGAIANIVTLGLLVPINRFTRAHFFSFSELIQAIALQTLLIINPKAQMQKKRENNTGFVTSALTQFYSQMNHPTASSNFFVKHVLSRLANILIGTTALVSAVVDVIFGILAYPLAIVTLGCWTKCNTFIDRQLANTQFISIIWNSLLFTINPAAEVD